LRFDEINVFYLFIYLSSVQEAARRAMPVERLHQEAEAKFNRIKVSST
jgi:hypothetical protein